MSLKTTLPFLVPIPAWQPCYCQSRYEPYFITRSTPVQSCPVFISKCYFYITYLLHICNYVYLTFVCPNFYYSEVHLVLKNLTQTQIYKIKLKFIHTLKHSITDMYVLFWSEGYGNFIDVFGLFWTIIL